MSEFKDFFAASVGAAAALVGLLFVAITLSPEKIFGAHADPAKRGQAVGAFIALSNVFFVSLATLLPAVAARVVLAFSLIAMYQVVREFFSMRRLFPDLKGWRRFGIVAFAIYTFELVMAVRLSLHAESLKAFAYVILGLYLYALWTSWSLLGVNVASEE